MNTSTILALVGIWLALRSQSNAAQPSVVQNGNGTSTTTGSPLASLLSKILGNQAQQQNLAAAAKKASSSGGLGGGSGGGSSSGAAKSPSSSSNPLANFLNAINPKNPSNQVDLSNPSSDQTIASVAPPVYDTPVMNYMGDPYYGNSVDTLNSDSSTLGTIESLDAGAFVPDLQSQSYSVDGGSASTIDTISSDSSSLGDLSGDGGGTDSGGDP